MTGAGARAIAMAMAMATFDRHRDGRDGRSDVPDLDGRGRNETVIRNGPGVSSAAPATR